MAIKMILLWNISLLILTSAYHRRKDDARVEAESKKGPRKGCGRKGERERISHHASIDSYFDFYFTIQKTADMIWEFIYGIFSFPHIMHDLIKIFLFGTFFWVFTFFGLFTSFSFISCRERKRRTVRSRIWFWFSEWRGKTIEEKPMEWKRFSNSLSCVVLVSSSFHFRKICQKFLREKEKWKII